jgi:hypothetical protein
MSIRQFHHSYSPSGQGTSGQTTIELNTTEIATAAIYEIIQMSLSASPFDFLLEQLLDRTDLWFRWLAQLGQVRETKTALSGLFGRFVARAYLTRYFQYGYYEPIRSDVQPLWGWPGFTINRCAYGDLPDWVIARPIGPTAFAIAEAKGSHNKYGPKAALNAAKEQVTRVNICAGRTVLKVKRFAIATRWAVQNNPNLDEPWLCVHDPDEGEREPSDVERRRLRRSAGLGHFAALAQGFGLQDTAAALRSAKNGEPGKLVLPSSDIIQVDLEGNSRRMIGAIVAGSSVISLPSVLPFNYVPSLRTVFGECALLFGIDVDRLYRLDLDDASPSHSHSYKDYIEGIDESTFFKRRRTEIDGMEFLPLSIVELRRHDVGS